MELSGLLIPNAMIEDHFEYWYIPSVNSSPMKFYIPFADFFPSRRRQERVLFSLRFSAPHRSVIFYKEEDSITDILCIELIKTRDSGEARPVVVSHIDHGSKTLVVELEDGFSEQTETFRFNDGMREKLEIVFSQRTISVQQEAKIKRKTVTKTQNPVESYFKESLEAYLNYSLVAKGADQNEVELCPVEAKSKLRLREEILEAMRHSILKALLLIEPQEKVFLDFSSSFLKFGSQLKVAIGYSASVPDVSGKRSNLVQLMAEQGVTGLLLPAWGDFIQRKNRHLATSKNDQLLLYTGHAFYVLTSQINDDTIKFPSDFQHLMTQTLIRSLTAFKIFLQIQVIPFLLKKQHFCHNSEVDFLKTWNSVKAMLFVRTNSSDIVKNLLVEIKEGSKLQRLIQFSDLEALQKLVIVIRTADKYTLLYHFNSDREIVKLNRNFRDLFAPDYTKRYKDSQYYQLLPNVAAAIVQDYTEELGIKIIDTSTVLAPAFDSCKNIAHSLLTAGKFNQWERLYKTCVDAEEKIEFILETFGFFRSPAYQDHSTFQTVADCVNKDMSNLPSAELFGKFILKYIHIKIPLSRVGDFSVVKKHSPK